MDAVLQELTCQAEHSLGHVCAGTAVPEVFQSKLCHCSVTKAYARPQASPDTDGEWWSRRTAEQSRAHHAV